VNCLQVIDFIEGGMKNFASADNLLSAEAKFCISATESFASSKIPGVNRYPACHFNFVRKCHRAVRNAAMR
jgi:hypothetical protein